jgi:hypothetical protein
MNESTLPHSEKDRDSAIGVDASGRMNYASGSESGHVEVVLPALAGSANGEERLLMKDFGVHVAGQIERSFSRQPYLRSGPMQSPPEVFSHFIASAKGARLLSPGAQARAEVLAREFAGESEREAYYEMVIKPWLFNLTSAKRRQP